jgi:hypothetical protein
MNVGAADDPSAITDMIPIRNILHIIKENGIYACQLADNIDPSRTNPHVPNVQQRVLTLGSDSELAGRTLLTANALFREHHFLPSFDHEAGVALAFDALKELAAMQELKLQFESALAVTELEDRREKDRSVVLPSAGNVPGLCKPFIQKADHVLQAMFGIVKLFYGKHAGKAWFESFAQLIVRQYGPDDQFSKFMADVLPFLKFIRNARNCVEHPTPSQRVVITDFVLNREMEIVPPTIEVIHSKSNQPAIPVAKFMAAIIDQASGIFELMVAFLCAKHVQSFAGFALAVVELPEDRRRQRHVRYSYAMHDGDRTIPVG